MTSYTQRVSDAAQQVSLVRLALSVLAAPLYGLGWLAGILVVTVMWMVAATSVGFSDARLRAARRSD